MTNIPMLARRIQNSVRAFGFGVVLGIFFLLALGAGPLMAEEDPGSGTVPPLTSFAGAVSPNEVQPGQQAFYTITILNGTNYVNVTISLTSTLPAGVIVNADTVTATVGTARLSEDGKVIWEGGLNQPNMAVLIGYQIQVADDSLCEVKAIQDALYEIANPGAGKPSDEPAQNTTTFTVGGKCPLYLPYASQALSPIPTLNNWNFEDGLKDPNWGQYDNEQASTLIYSTDKKSIAMPQGGKWFGWLGGVLNMTSELRQKIALPANHRGIIKLRFLYFIESADDCGQDNGYVLLDSEQIGNTYQLCKTTAAGAWKQAEIPVDAKYLGKELTLTLRSRTSALKNSNWLIDNVKFCSTDTQAAVEDRCP